jgi:hypothetical protein
VFTVGSQFEHRFVPCGRRAAHVSFIAASMMTARSQRCGGCSCVR